MSIPSVEEVVALNSTGTEAVISAVRQVLGRGDVLDLSINAGDALIRFRRIATEEEIAQQSELSYHDVVRARPMEEYIPEEEIDPYRQLFEMFEMLEDAGVRPSIILSGRPVPKLREWVDRMSRKSKTLFGLRILVEEDIPEDNLILCGTDGEGDGPEAVRYSVKATMP